MCVLAATRMHLWADARPHRQLTHGFPVSPNPLFLSDAFPIENRPGLSDQSVEALCRQLAQAVPEGSSGDSLDATERNRVEKILSDWHLVYFAAGSGVFSEVSAASEMISVLLTRPFRPFRTRSA